MRYLLKDINSATKAFEYLIELTGKEAVVDITKVNPKRSGQANRYYHLLLGIFGLETGYTIEEVKTLHKRKICPEMFMYEKKGEKFLRSSADLDSAEMTKAIDRFKEYAAEQGCPLPPADNQEELIRWQNLIEQNNHYL